MGSYIGSPSPIISVEIIFFFIFPSHAKLSHNVGFGAGQALLSLHSQEHLFHFVSWLDSFMLTQA